ncbi:lytic murein transglycosylase [Xinfangfangia sp. CPCC 101601]|uniref:Lytic murein transglycosylase n=1 Tax=Pseudogemmobacter lacusdianii TaxID=3069608 RepID=A0ABU0VY17_9RHOB|nr:lytic murein transglycosylase [Xinfangfangia sp. CPCC 101601]MDQ2066518.1 lytic murein transglycosylase [Xinfangfangia sp. CPCC 101601]
MLLLCLCGLPALAQTIEVEGTSMASGREDGTEAGLQAWVQEFRARALEAGVSAPVFDREMRGASYLPDVIARDRRQTEFTKTIWDYLDIAVSEERVAMGLKALKTHADLLAKIEAEYGVEKEVVVAVWGLETSYGSYRGDTDTLSALASLAYDGRRGAFFEAQLLQALQILGEGHVARADFKGSWAGAMGHTQFMPTSWAEFAVDHDGDGKRDIWGADPGDALASTANYLRHWGWTKGQPWGLEVTLPQGFDYDQTSERVKKPVAAWHDLGVKAAHGSALPEGAEASILLPAGHSGPAFLIFPNFQVIEKYNLADAYVIGIGHLSDRLRGGDPIKAPWPRHWRALTLDERKELQAALVALGHDTGGVDGRIGPKTIAAVKAWQKTVGQVPDGYPSPDVLSELRGPG